MHPCIFDGTKAFLDVQPCTGAERAGRENAESMWELPRNPDEGGRSCDRDGPAGDHLPGDSTGWQLGITHIPRTGRAADRRTLCPAAHQAGAVGVAPGRARRPRRPDRVRASHQRGARLGRVNRQPPCRALDTGTPPVRLWLASDRQRVLIRVWDGNDRQPTPQHPGPDAESGRGLLLVESLSVDWGSYPPERSSGKVVWAIVTESAMPA